MATPTGPDISINATPKQLGSAVEIVKVANGYIVWGPYDFQTNGRKDMSVTMVFETFERMAVFLRDHLASVQPDTPAYPGPR